MIKRKSEREKIQDQAQKRRERIISLYNNEMKIKDIAESEGVSTTTITRDITQLVKAGKVKRKKPFKEKRYQEMEERRERIIPLYDNGMSIKDIAESEGVSMPTIANDIEQLMKAGRVKKQETFKEKQHQEIEERRERIISLYNKGMRIKDIAEIEGVLIPTISKDIKRLLKAGKVKKRKTLNEKQHQEMEERRERIIPLYDNGMSIKDIAESEGVSMTTIANDIEQLMKAGRVKKQGTLKEKHYQEIEERRERIISLYNKGMRIKDIAESEGVSITTITRDITQLVKAGKVKKRKTLNEKQHQEVEDNEELMAKSERRTIWAVLRDKIESGNRKAIESYIDKILEVRPKSFSKEDFELILKYKNVISFAKTRMEKSDRETLMEEKKNLLDNEEER